MAKAGIEPEKRIVKRTIAQRINNTQSPSNRHAKGLNVKYEAVIDKEDVLSEYVPSPKQRVITEYELLGALISKTDLPEEEKRK